MATNRSAVTIRLQPLPVLTMMGRLNGVTAITRQWADDDHERCTLCSECSASEEGLCIVLTEEDVTEGGAPLYSRVGFRGDRETTRPAAVFGRR